MKLRVLFFGATADAADTRETDIEFTESDSAGMVIERLSQQFPRLKDHKLLVALNEEYIDFKVALKDGDELAVFTAVSGG